MRIFITLLVLLGVVSITFFLFFNKQIDLFPTYKKISGLINSHPISLYLADTSVKQDQGLSNIQKLPEDQGMIFIFSKPGYYYFWMKDMRFPLDFVFLKDSKVIDLAEHISPKTYPKTYSSSSPADSVIELNGGMIQKLNIRIGDSFQLQKK